MLGFIENPTNLRAFLFKFARIKYENYMKEIFQVVKLIENFLDSRQHHHLGEQKREIGTVPFYVNGKMTDLHVKVFLDPKSPIAAGIETKHPNVLLVNLREFQYSSNSFERMDKIKNLVVHEITHFLDFCYSPLFDKQITSKDSADFHDEFIKLFTRHNQQISYDELSTFWGKNLEHVAKRHFLRFLKSKTFKDLCTKHDVTLDHETMGKLYRQALDLFIEDMTYYQMTGGNPFLISPHLLSQDKELVEKTQETARKLYFRSDAEMKAYGNQIIQEVMDYLQAKDRDKTLIKIIRGEVSVGANIDWLLEKSDTFRANKTYLDDMQLQYLREQLANYITSYYHKLTSEDWENKAGVKLSGPEKMIYRYLLKLYQDGSQDKLLKLIRDPEFSGKHKNALIVLRQRVNFDTSLDNLVQTLFQID